MTDTTIKIVGTLLLVGFALLFVALLGSCSTMETIPYVKEFADGKGAK